MGWELVRRLIGITARPTTCPSRVQPFQMSCELLRVCWAFALCLATLTGIEVLVATETQTLDTSQCNGRSGENKEKNSTCEKH